jgi:acyl-coenzyme A synthetase/AMP-(fatty) acid ligase
MIPVLDLLSRCAADSPHRDALRIGGEAFSYSQLRDMVHEHVEVISPFRNFFPPGAFLPLQTAQDSATYVAVLACLEAGVPLGLVDPSTPPARTEKLLPLYSATTVLQARDVLDETKMAAVFSGAIHEGAEKILSRTGLVPSLGLASSGTTGEPKLIALDSEALKTRLRPDVAGLPWGDSLSCSNTFSPIHFGGGFWRLGDVLHGITLQVMSIRDYGFQGLIDSLVDGGVDLIRLPTNVVRLLSRNSRNECLFPRAKVFKIGVGEAALAHDVLAVSPLFPAETVVWHSLSATESGEMFRWTGNFSEIDFPDRLPIGRPAPGRQVSVVAATGEHTGVGEVVARGEAVALGYVSDGDVSDRFTIDSEGERTWFSGDLVVEGDDGWFYHRSRADDVVKVLGRFVALADIDQAARALEGITDSVTVSMNGAVERLETHVEIGVGGRVTSGQIRTHLASMLPNHMIPARIIVHEQLPRTVRGKIDKKSLAP